MGMQIRWKKLHQSEKNLSNLGREGKQPEQALPKVHKEVHRSLSLKRQGNCMKGFVSGCYGDLGSLPPASQLLSSLGDFTQQVLFVSWGFFVSFCSYCDCKTWEAPLPSLLQKALGMGLEHPHNTSAKPGKDHCARRRTTKHYHVVAA